MAPVNGSHDKVISPSKLAHIVFRTNKFDKMKHYYKTFLGGHAVIENEILSFITYDDEHHRIAIINMPHLQDSSDSNTGLEHIAFTFDSLQDLCKAYKQRKALGITPGWCVNHGPTTSMYYQDPDGNRIETQVDNFDDPDKATEMMMSPEFGENSLGADFDPEELCRRVEAGEDEGEIKKRPNIGPRGAKDLPEITAKLNTSQTGV